MKYLTAALAFLGAFAAATATTGCFIIFADEPEMPESLL